MKLGSHFIVMRPEFPGIRRDGSVFIDNGTHRHPMAKFELYMAMICEGDASWTNKKSEQPEISQPDCSPCSREILDRQTNRQAPETVS